MTTLRRLLLLCSFCSLGCRSASEAGPFTRWDDGTALRKVQGLQSGDLSDILLRDQQEEEERDVFKRFLFHYSKARNSVGAVQHTSHSVHPLMRLSPKLSQKKRKVLLLKIRALPEGCCDRMI